MDAARVGRPRVPRAAWAAAFVLAFGLAFPFRVGDLRADLGLVLGWLAIAPFVRMIDGLEPRAALRWGTFAGTGAYAIVMFWLFVVVYQHGHAPMAVGVLAVLAMSLAFGLHLGLVAWIARRLEPAAGPLAWLVIPAAWVVLEHLRGFLVFGGLPWALLGHATHQDGPIRALAAFVGVFGLSALLALFGVLLARGRAFAALALLAAAHVAGFGAGLAWRAPEADPGEALRVGIVQGNVPQGEKWDRTRAAAVFDAHVEASRLAAAGAELDWIVWPETAVPVLLELDGRARRELSALATETGATLIVGGMGIELDASGRAEHFYNSVFVVDSDGRFRDRYDKAKLVPFGEYVPLRSLLGFLSGIARGLSDIDVTPGPRARTLEGSESFGAHAPAALICYEVIYPALVRSAVRGGARVLLNLTNDAWYGRSSAPHQFLAIAAMRSAEHGLPMVRAANTGVSAVIDAGGGVLEQTPIFESRALAVRVPAARADGTVYTRLGDWVVRLGWLLLVGLALRQVAGRAAQRGRTEGAERGED